MKNKILTLVAVLFCTLQVIAQEIKGKIVDAGDKSALEFVNIALYKEGSDKLLKGITSDLDGSFRFTDIQEGTYQLQVSFVGYTTIRIPIVLSKTNKNPNLGVISLKEDSKTLKEVQVTGQRSQMKFDLDKKVFNVDQNIASAGQSASDALANIPSVSVDSEGNVSLRNNSAVTIWINGRPSGLSEDNRAQILEQLPAESIESIEVITNPSARFSSEGSAGIINIVMKKEKKTGYYGDVTTNADTQGGYGASANINANYNKLDTYLSAGYRRRKMISNGESHRESFIVNPDGSQSISSILDQINDGEGSGGGFFTRVGGIYNFTKKDALGLSGSMMIGTHDRRNSIENSTTFPDERISENSRYTDSQNNHNMYTVAIDYTHTFSKDHELRLMTSYDFMDRTGNTSFEQIYPDRLFNQLQTNATYRRGIEAQADYSYKINDLIKIESGYRGTINSRNSNTQTWDGLEKLPEMEDLSLYNRFRYDENIQAIYATMAGGVGKLSYQGGLRGEYTHYETETVGSGIAEDGSGVNSRSYFDLFPSAFVSYSLPKGNEMQINYTRRINRPRGRSLNPFRNLSDSTNISFGNPLLAPEYTDAVELNYIKNWSEHMLSASLYYRSTSDVIQGVSYLEGNALYSTSENVTDSRRAGMELVGKNRLFKILDLTTTVNLYYLAIDSFNFIYKDDESFFYNGQKNFSWDARIIANFKMPWSTSLQLTGSYRSPITTPQGKTYEIYALDAGIRKSFLDRKLNVAITGRDIFNSRRNKSYQFGEGYEMWSNGIWGGRQFGITLSYGFGNMRANQRKQRNNRNGDMMDGGGMED